VSPLPDQSRRLARHDRIFLVGPLIEFLNMVPELGFVDGTTRPKPRRRDTLIIHPEVVHWDFAADFGVDSRTLHLRWTTSAASLEPARNWIQARATPVSCQVRLPIGVPRRCGGGCQRRRRASHTPVGRLICW